MPTLALPSATIDYHVVGPTNSAHPPIVRPRRSRGPPTLGRGRRPAGRQWLPLLPAHSAAGVAPHRVDTSGRWRRRPQSPGAATLLREFVATLGLADATLVCNDTGGAITSTHSTPIPSSSRASSSPTATPSTCFRRNRSLLFTLLQRKAGTARRRPTDASEADSAFPARCGSARQRHRRRFLRFGLRSDPRERTHPRRSDHVLAPHRSRGPGHRHATNAPGDQAGHDGVGCRRPLLHPSHGRTFAEVFPDAHFIESPRTHVRRSRPARPSSR